MRLKDYAEREGKRVWLSSGEISEFLAQANSPQQTAAFILGARCGLRREEIVNVRRIDVRRTDIGDVVRVWEGKGDKYRETPCPSRLKHMLSGMELEPDEAIVDVDESTVYRWVSRAGEHLHAETGDEGWLELGPHDLRRSWGIQLLEQGVLPSVVMEWGGWEDWETFREHYLAEFSPEALRRECQKVDYLADVSRDNEEVEVYSVVETQYP